METQDSKILDILDSNPDGALRLLYSSFYRYVCTVIYNMIGDSATAEDIAQEVFVEVWKRRETLDINTSLKGYLRRIAVNKTLNQIRTKKMDFENEEAVIDLASKDMSSQKIMEAEDLQGAINASIEKLPERCRMIFGLSRFEELSYREIAEKLTISIKTVENQMSKALKIVRASVLEYQTEEKIIRNNTLA